MNPIHTPFRFLLLRWHRRAGLCVAVFVLILASTGLLLNHTEELGLDDRYVETGWLLNWYGIKPAPTISYQVNDQWVTDRSGSIYLQSKPVHSCSNGLAGAATLGGELLIACRNSLALLQQDGMIIERIDATLGLPVPIEHLANDKGRVVLSSGGKYFELDLDQLRFAPAQGSNPEIISPHPTPAALLKDIQNQSEGHSIHWERLLLDLHSGRLFGRAGVYLFDAAAVLLIFLALSGFYYWAAKPASRR